MCDVIEQEKKENVKKKFKKKKFQNFLVGKFRKFVMLIDSISQVIPQSEISDRSDNK